MATSTKDLSCKKSRNISDAALLYIYKNGGKSGNPENTSEETPVQTDTVQKVFSDFLQSCGGHSDTQMDKTILEDRLVELEKKKKEKEELSMNLNGEKCTLVFIDPESLINDLSSKCEVELKNKIQEAESIVNKYCNEHEKMHEEREASYQLSLAKAEDKAEKALQLNEQLELDNTYLVTKLLSLQEEMEEKDMQLSELSRLYNEKLEEYEMEKQAHSVLNEMLDEMKKKEEPLQSSVGQVKNSSKIALASTSELEHEKDQMQTLQDKLKEVEKKSRTYEEKLSEEEVHKADKKKKRSFFKKLKKWFRNLVR